MQHWTDETDREADRLYATMTNAKIRQWQSLVEQQMTLAYQQHNLDALADLTRCRDALFREMFQRCGRKSTGPRIRPRKNKT